MNTSERGRTIIWQDSTAISRRAMEPGYLSEWLSDSKWQPPICSLMNITLAEVTSGRAVFTSEPDEYLYNPMGTAHGGYVSTLIDSATGIAVMSCLPEGTPWATSSLNINFIKSIKKETGQITCIGNILHKGNKIIIAEAKVLDKNDQVYAIGQASCLILSS